MVADRGDALQAPAGRNIARVEEQRVADGRVLEVLVDDLGDRDRRLPLPVVVRHVRQRAAVDEGELAALEQHAAIGRREAAAALGAVGDDLADRELAGERLALRFEIDARGEALELVASRLAGAQSATIVGEISRRSMPAARRVCWSRLVSGSSASGCDKLGARRWDRADRGRGPCGRVAFATETSVSPVGPAWAGAIVDAVSAAQNSSAERKEAKIRRKRAVNHRKSG